MTLTVDRYTQAIAEHSRALALAANGALDRPVEHCPGWSVEDVVRHLLRVQWFWATIVEERLSEPPTNGEPVDVTSADVIDRFSRGARHLVAVLREAVQSDAVYTWAPLQHDVAFITRHQVQEIAVHHWDVEHAVGGDLVIDGDVARDAVSEFLTFSVSSEVDPADPPRPALDGHLGLRCAEVDQGWTIRDGSTAGVITFRDGVDETTPSLRAPSSDVLLWLYRRVELDTDDVTGPLAARFRALTYTD